MILDLLANSFEGMLHAIFPRGLAYWAYIESKSDPNDLYKYKAAVSLIFLDTMLTCMIVKHSLWDTEQRPIKVFTDDEQNSGTNLTEINLDKYKRKPITIFFNAPINKENYCCLLFDPSLNEHTSSLINVLKKNILGKASKATSNSNVAKKSYKLYWICGILVVVFALIGIIYFFCVYNHFSK